MSALNGDSTRDMALAEKSELALEAGTVGVNHMKVSTPETPSAV
jgi:succinate-semialdehyde dehydrogenase/glutarate-semialdehyde dehydrogenase